MNAINTKDKYVDILHAAMPSCLIETHLQWGQKYQGKVRDSYHLDDKILLVTTDRLSAFDRQIAAIPYKGQVLNLISAWWFEKTADIVPNHFIAVPDANVTLAKKCTVFPIEFVVRGYITGTTSTSLWTQYHQGKRSYCGISLPQGLRKNQRLDQAILTPTTKEKEQDRPISPKEIIAEGWMSESDWEEASALALKLFAYGTALAAKHGLILVDTKYEFGRDLTGQIVVVDEIHTPDSSRYWLANSYEECFALGDEPENIDKEFLRLWFAKNCDPYQDAPLPQAPADLVVTLAARYIQLYEMITGQSFAFPQTITNVNERIMRNVGNYLISLSST